MIIKDWKSLFFSICFFIRLIFIGQKYDVVFVSSAYFNRGKLGENKLFQPMIECCKKNNLSYKLFEDTDLKGEYVQFNRFKGSIPLDFISLTQVILRKIYNIIYKEPILESELYIRELKISKIISRLFFNKFYSKVYITLLWNNVTLWRSINPDACVIDYQHGIIFDGHDRYIKDGIPPKVKSSNEIVTLVYGDTFKNILINSDKSNFYCEENVKKIGFNKQYSKQKKVIANNKKILFTLQIVPDFNDEDYDYYVEIINNLIKNNTDFLLKNNYEIIFKHHPRYNTTNCRDFKIDHDLISFDEKTSTLDLMKIASIHMTFHSTSAIEAALMSIPTIFIDMHEKFSPNEIFLNQYEYPCKDFVIKDFSDLRSILSKINDKQIYNKYCNDVHKWSQGLYNDFDNVTFEDFLLRKINTHNIKIRG